MFLFYVLWLGQPCELNSCLKLQVTKESFRDDGFFKTGDTVTIVDGYVKILGRESMLALESLCSILSVACLFIVVVLLHSQEVSAWFYISSQTCFATTCSYHALWSARVTVITWLMCFTSKRHVSLSLHRLRCKLTGFWIIVLSRLTSNTFILLAGGCRNKCGHSEIWRLQTISTWDWSSFAGGITD